MDPYQNPAASPYAPQVSQYARRRAAFGGLGSGLRAPAYNVPSGWRPPGGALPAGVPQGQGGADYTAANAELARRSRAAMDDPNSPTYQSPELRAKMANANAMQAAANPGFTYNESPGGGGYWTPDAAHNNAAGSAAFANSWQNLGKANPQAFDVPTDAQGRPIDARTGQAAVNQQTGQLYPGTQPAAAAPYNPADYQLKAPAMNAQGMPAPNMADAQRASQATVGSPAPAANQAPPVAQQYANPGGTPAPMGMGMDDQRRRLQVPMV